MPTDGQIVDTRTIKLNRAEEAAVARLYSREVISETIVEEITYYSDDLKVKGFVARPRIEGQYPVLIWNRGGSGEHAKIRRWIQKSIQQK